MDWKAWNCKDGKDEAGKAYRRGVPLHHGRGRAPPQPPRAPVKATPSGHLWIVKRRDHMRQKTRNVLAAAGCAALVWAAGAGTGHAATAQTTTTATVLLPITITKTADLNFGKFMSSAAGGTVVVSTAGAQSVTGTLTTTAALGATASAATFTISGEPSSTYAVSFPAQTVLDGPGADMTIGDFSTASTGTLGTFGAAAETLTVGATLTVNANQASGAYNGTLDVAVNYN